MARLMPNIRLSCAQFSHEVTGGHIHDKVAVSTRRAKDGCCVPSLGYDVPRIVVSEHIDRKLCFGHPVLSRYL